MADKQFHLDIVTPDRTVYSGIVQSFSAPGVIGTFQVLFNHAPMLSAIGIGEIKVITSDGTVKMLATGGGFVEVKNNKVVLLAESAESQDEIDVERAQRSKDRAAERLVKKSRDVDIERAKFALYRSLNRLKLSSVK